MAIAHSSLCSARMAPTRRVTAPRFGKIPTTSLRRRISLFNRSCGSLLERIFAQCSRGNAAKAEMSSAASSTKVAASAKPVAFRRSTTSPSCDQVVSASGCSKIERTGVATIPQEAFGTLEAGLAMKWVRQRCQVASASTVAIAA